MELWVGGNARDEEAWGVLLGRGRIGGDMSPEEDVGERSGIDCRVGIGLSLGGLRLPGALCAELRAGKAGRRTVEVVGVVIGGVIEFLGGFLITGGGMDLQSSSSLMISLGLCIPVVSFSIFPSSVTGGASAPAISSRARIVSGAWFCLRISWSEGRLVHSRNERVQEDGGCL